LLIPGKDLDSSTQSGFNPGLVLQIHLTSFGLFAQRSAFLFSSTPVVVIAHSNFDNIDANDVFILLDYLYSISLSLRIGRANSFME